MRVTPLEHPEVLLVEPDVFPDARGFFMETFHADKYALHGLPAMFLQDNHSRSVRGVLRGLHYQLNHPQGKLVRVIEGEIFDVSVDVRRGSPTYGKHFATRLSADNFHQLYIPPGVLHGFLVTSDFAQVLYKCTDFYRPEADFSVAWNDPEFGIAWPIESPILSEKDRCAPRLQDVESQLIDYAP